MKSKSPRATIGNQARFEKESSIGVYKSKLPCEYVINAAKVKAKKIQLGKIGTAQRFFQSKFQLRSPGVGSYNLSMYKSMAKASETHFSFERLNRT